jgi:sugar lactone lactonase YvrE
MVLTLGLAGGCQSPSPRDAPLLLFPSPPATPRIQFLTWASSAEEIEGPVSLVTRLALGDEPVDRPAINKPYGLAARDGVVYVCDTKLPGICRLDFKEHTFTVLGVRGPGRLRKPLNLVIDPLGYKFVADALRKQVVVFGPDDEYVTAFNIPEPSHPVDVALWENELYVLDNDDTCQIVVLDRQTSEILRTFGTYGEGIGEFRIPNSLCFSPDGHLYVSDTLNWRVHKMTREGESAWIRGTAGQRLGQFGRPRSIRVGPDGIAYVTDAATEIVQMFSEDGEILMHFGGPGFVPGALVLPAGVAVDATSLPYFRQYIHKDFSAEYLLFVASQYGRHLISVYAFGSFPEGYQLSQSQIASLPAVGGAQDIKPAAPSEGVEGKPDTAGQNRPSDTQD